MREQIRKIPVITVIIAAVNILVWIGLEAVGSTYDSEFMIRWGAAYTPLILERGEWWRLLSCTFLHFGAEHLLNNMFIFVLTGMRLEKFLGRFPFAMLYLLSGFAGSALSFLIEIRAGEIVVSAGASGAVFGVLGGLIAAAICNHGKVEGLSLKGLFVMLALNLYNGFTTAGVDNWGHIGGFAGGFLLCFLFCLMGIYRKD
ncbi:MAG: rhomboid family intramembrane serine protease [Lachnospiraceae bacterium]|nr:rhomboid family intramembrane serine protease [Lachnospiraceae bacterium]MDE6982830.1 rhomboid family intramembrane serine protease [Lachnospiraceae bacterium]